MRISQLNKIFSNLLATKLDDFAGKIFFIQHFSSFLRKIKFFSKIFKNLKKFLVDEI